MALCCGTTALVEGHCRVKSSAYACCDDRTLFLTPRRPQVSFVLSLKESDASIAAIKKTALEVSDPDSPKYGQFLTAADIVSLTTPDKEDLNIVTSWLESSGVTAWSVKGSRVEVESTTAQAEKLFQTKFAILVNQEEGAAVHRAGAYRLPAFIEVCHLILSPSHHPHDLLL